MSSFRTFSRSRRCPLCNADHACAVTSDGLHHCHHRTGEEVSGWVFLGVSKIGFGMYRREDDPQLDRERLSFPRPDATPRVTPSASHPAPSAGADQAKALESWCEGAGRHRLPLSGSSPQAASWAADLGLPSPKVFELLDTQWLSGDERNAGDVLCFPERNGQGEIIGYNRRYHDNAKLAVGKRGITIPRGMSPTSFIHDAASAWSETPQCGPIYLVEGASDVLALLAMGRNAIGRPSATGGADHLVDFLRTLPRQRWDCIVILGENDRKQDGRWPGREGAYRLAKRLADDLGVAVRVAFPPNGSKDVRDFLKTEVARAKTKPWVQDRAAYAAVAWDEHCARTADVQYPHHEMRHQSPIHHLVMASVLLTTATVTTSEAQRPDLSDLGGPRIAAMVERGRQTGTLPDPYQEETAAKAAIMAARKDREHYPCCHPRYLGFLRNHNGRPWIGEVRCEKRSCPGCRQWLDLRELANAGLRFHQAEKDGCPLQRFECSAPETWKALYAALQRAKASFYRVQLPDGRFVVFTTFVPSKRSSWHGKGVAIDAASAKQELATLLALCDHGKRPCSTSHDWKLLVDDEKTSQSTFIGRIDSQTVHNILAIADTVAAVVVPRLPKTPNGSMRRCWDFLRPDGWNDDYREHLFACWFCGEALPYRSPEEREEQKRRVGTSVFDGDPLDVESMFC